MRHHVPAFDDGGDSDSTFDYAADSKRTTRASFDYAAEGKRTTRASSASESFDEQDVKKQVEKEEGKISLSSSEQAASIHQDQVAIKQVAAAEASKPEPENKHGMFRYRKNGKTVVISGEFLPLEE